ncbi:MAG: glycosyltransferase, partial [Bacteroidales bacterium]|nr:glycosyltransferase [Bacteroidales bacterium]
MKLSVIIVNYNIKYFLEQCLYSVRKACKGIESEIFVVDNNSVDGSVKMTREKFPEVIVIANNENKGFSKANNQAIKKAKGEYILLLNPDTVVEDD